MKRGMLLIGLLAAAAGWGGELEIPVPPQQQAPWTRPKVDLPEKLFVAAETLFKQGLADPRGLEYREVEVRAWNWRDVVKLVKTHGWVFPEKAGEKQRFAVMWNGLVYPVATVGAVCELKSDGEEMVKGEQARIDEKNTRDPRLRFKRSTDSPTPEDSHVSHTFIQPSAVVMVLRLGEGELAKKIWDVWTIDLPVQRDRNQNPADDPYATLALDWAWALYDRATRAHARGDDPLALASVRLLCSIRPGIEAECQSRGWFSNVDDKYRFLTSYLRESDKLLVDQERRAKSAKGENDLEPIRAQYRGRTDVDWHGLPNAPKEIKEKIKEKWPGTAARVRMLVENLDTVDDSRYLDRREWFDFYDDIVYAMLVDEGRNAVEALIDCLEKDTRLTRSVGFSWRYRYITIVPVNEVAYEALQSILRTRKFGGIYTSEINVKGPDKAAAAVREYWNPIKDVSLEESWYLGLANDSLSRAQWVQFAGTITSYATGAQTRRGEVLRSKKNPSVSELLTKRTKMCCDAHDLNAARDLARDLYHWEPAQSAEALRAFCAAVQPQLDANKTSGWASTASEFVTMRMALGDEAALNDYAAWLPRFTPPERVVFDQLQTSFQPIWQHPEYPAIKAAAEKLFTGPESAWRHFFDASQRFIDKKSFLKSWLLGVEPFRKLVLRALADRTEMGAAEIREKGFVSAANVGTAGMWKGDPLAPPVGTKVAFRVCDLVGEILSGVDGIPRCEVYWPEKERDAALAKIVEFLQKRSEWLRWREKLPSAAMFDSNGQLAMPNIARLDHPATKEDVEKQHAIFSLEGEGERRLVEMPAFPRRARWLKCPNPVKQDLDSHTFVKPTDEGFVWQVEEVMKDGKWKRFVGYIGAHEVLQLPEEDVEYLPWR